MKKNLTFYSILFISFLFLQRGSGLVTKLILANIISPYEYGLITLIAISLPALFQVFICLNYYNILSHSSEGRDYFTFTIISSIIIGIIISLILFFNNELFFNFLNIPSEYHDLFYFAIIFSMFSMGLTVDFQGLLTGLRLYSKPGIVVAIPAIVRLIFVFILYVINIFSFEMIILFFAFSNAFPLFYLLLSKKRKYYLPYLNSIKIPSKKMISFGTALFVVGSYSTIGITLIKIVISHNLGIEWQGYFDVSMTLASIGIFFIGTMNFLAVPEATKSDKELVHYNSEFGEISRLLFSGLIFLFILTYFYSDFIVRVLFSEKFIYASEYCWIIIIGYILLYVQNYLAKMNISYAKKKKEYIVQTIFPLLLLPLFFYLTEFLINIFNSREYGNGFIGPYASYCLLAMALTLCTVLFSSNLKPLDTFRFKFKKLALTFIITFGLFYFFQPPAIIGIPTSFILYILLLFSTKYINLKTFFEIFK